MLIKGIEQSSPDWHSFRSKGIGSSDIAVVMGVSPYKTRHRLYLEKTGQAEQEDLSQNPIVQKGVRLEPEARRHVGTHFGYDFETVLFKHDAHPFLLYSSDGFNAENDRLIEVKCPQAANHAKAKNDEIPEYYRMQVQYGLLVSGAKHATFVSYRPEDEMQIAIVDVVPDPALHEKMIEEASKFWQLVETMTPPELTSKDWVEETRDDLVDMAKLYAEKKDKARLLEVELDSLSERLKAMAGDRPAVRVSNVCIQKISAKGAIQYTKIPELKSMDLEKYRGPCKNYHKITVK